ncbi:MAG TPA: PIN domain-containing protein [Thermoanaerobaculia bacterium]|nr:PIN domain-containing protein [Thermoanaerobaculia bacterium]
MGGPEHKAGPERKQGGATTAGPGAQRAAQATGHPLVALQRSMGNQAVQRLLGVSPAAPGLVQRQPNPGAAPGGPAGGRVILLDANVIGEINRGNAQAAQALLSLRGSAKVYISRQAFNELTSQPGTMMAGVGPDLPRTAAANRLLLEDLGIEVAPPGAAADRIGVHETNINKMKGNISSEDLAHVAQAKAIGAELFSLDRAFRKQAAMIEKQLGVKIAPESLSVELVGNKKKSEDYRVARQLLGLDEVEITVGGRVKRPPKTPAGGGPPGGPGGSGGPQPSHSTATPARPAGTPAKPAATPKISPEIRAVAREAARTAATDLSLLRAGRILKTATQVLEGVSALDTFSEFKGMAMSQLAGRGFVLTGEIAQAQGLEKQAREMGAAYAPFSESVTASTFRLAGASLDPLSAGQAGVHVADLLDQLTDLSRDLGERIDSLDQTVQIVNAKRQAALNILNSRSASAALVMATFTGATHAKLFAVSQDLQRISGALKGALASFRGMKAMVDDDIATLAAWDDALFESCKRGGYCSSRTVHIPFVGDSRMRSYPGE